MSLLDTWEKTLDTVDRNLDAARINAERRVIEAEIKLRRTVQNLTPEERRWIANVRRENYANYLDYDDPQKLGYK